MSKRGYIVRYMLIIKRLKAKPFSTFDDLQQYMLRQSALLGLQDDTLVIGFSLRTLQRDIREIRTLFGIDIVSDRKKKGYHILENSYDSGEFERMMEGFDVFQTMQRQPELNGMIALEQRKSPGTDHLYGLLHAIRNKLYVNFDYFKFWENKQVSRMVAPYLLKEFRNRWYLIGQKKGESQLITYALDRISGMSISASTFEPDILNPHALFDNAFGIMTGDGAAPEEIILSFTAFQGNYIKTLPLHHSQEIIIDSEEELRIRLKLFATYDLLMELRSFGEEVEVIAPLSLRKQL